MGEEQLRDGTFLKQRDDYRELCELMVYYLCGQVVLYCRSGVVLICGVDCVVMTTYVLCATYRLCTCVSHVIITLYVFANVANRPIS